MPGFERIVSSSDHETWLMEWLVGKVWLILVSLIIMTPLPLMVLLSAPVLCLFGVRATRAIRRQQGPRVMAYLVVLVPILAVVILEGIDSWIQWLR